MSRINHIKLSSGKNSKGQHIAIYMFEHKGLTKYKVLLWQSKNSRHTNILKPVLSMEQAMRFYQDQIDAPLV